MIRIRYLDFSAGSHDVTGLHGRAERCARGVTVYLLPGLTAWQRRAVIRRLRQEASRGFGPPLPLPLLAIALGLARVRAAARMGAAIVRLHPAATLVPSALVMAMMTLFVVASAGGRGSSPVPAAQGGLAEVAAVGGSDARRTVSARPGSARMARVATAEGAHGASDGGAGLGAGQRSQGKQAPAQRSHEKSPVPDSPLRASSRSGAWYVCPQARTWPAWGPRDGQLACHCAWSWAVPQTAQRPGPLDFAR